jgi:hypothetical protein
MLLACGTPTTTPAPLPDGLLVAPGAVDVKTPKAYEGAVTYLVREAYPADTLLGFLRQELASRGWTPQNEGVFSPGEESSHVRGWSEMLIEGEKHAPDDPPDVAHVYEWHGEWRDKNGGVASYSLWYREPEASRPYGAGPVSVQAIYLSKENAEAVKAGLGNAVKRPF